MKEVKINNPETKEEENKKKNKPVLDFMIKTMNGMAFGLFATLIIGTILGTIGSLFEKGSSGFSLFMFKMIGNGSFLASGFSGISYILEILTGAGIGIGIAYSLGFTPLQTIVLSGVGEISAVLSLSTKFVTNGIVSDGLKIGDPLTIYLVCVAVALLIKYVLKKKTPVDILLIPLFGVVCGTVISYLVRYPAIYLIYAIQWVVNEGTLAVPFIMGIVVAVVMGMALTAPISSAAIAAMVFTGTGEGLMIASGAAVIGCATQMVGFAIQSRKDNSLGMVISIGIGTSMLQFKNILKNPLIWLPTIISSAILGPISTCLIKTVCMGSSAGMGTSGLVGIIGTISSMGNTWQMWFSVFGLEIIIPGVLVFIIDLLMRKIGWIKPGDLKV